MSNCVVAVYLIVILNTFDKLSVNSVKDLVPTIRRDVIIRFAKFFAIAQNDKKNIKNPVPQILERL